MAGLEGTVDVPLAGKVSKKYAVAGLLVTGTLVIVYYYRKKKSAPAAAAAAATTTDQYPPDGTTGNPQDLYSTDPATGATYGNELAGSGGTFGAFPATSTGVTDTGTAAGSGNPATPGGPPFANNSAWSNWVIQELQALNPGIDTGALTDAIGVYLEGGQVTPAQKTLVFDALAVAGDPPVAGANNYPPKVRTSPTTNHTTVTVPQLVGSPVGDAESALSALGLKSRANATSGTVTAQSPAAGRRVADGSLVTLTVKQGGPKPPAAEIVVPNVVRQRVENAVEALADAGLKATFGTRKPRVAYHVTATSPKAGTRVKKGSTVHLTIAEGA